MKWFRMYSEINDDPKMGMLTDHQFRLWVGLMGLANESEERGTILPRPRAGLAWRMRTTPDALNEALCVFASPEMGMIREEEDGRIVLVNFLKRQYDHPSDTPEETAKRKKEQREREKRDQLVTPNERHEDVTPVSRPHTAEDRSRIQSSDTEVRGTASKDAASPPRVRELRPDQQMFAALRDSLGTAPETESERGKWNKAISMLRRADPPVSFEDIPELVDAFKAHYDGITITPLGLAGNLGTIRNVKPPGRSNALIRAGPNGSRASPSKVTEQIAINHQVIDQLKRERTL